mgnify:CR=1 FL=1|jgi:large subunit ribosomal protein L10
MSKAVKSIVMRDYQDRIGDHQDAMLISIRGISSNDTNQIRKTLRTKDIRVTMVRNALFRKTYEGTGLEPLGRIMTGANALAYGSESVVEVAREIVALVKTFPGIELKGAVLDGQVFEGEAGVKALSKYPTRDEAIAQDITLILSPGRKLVGAIKGPGGRLGGIIKAIEDKLEKGEAISKIG